MHLLAFDTSTDTLSIAVARSDTDTLWTHSGPGGAQASATLIPTVLRLLAELEAETGDIDSFRSLGLLLAKPDEKGVDKLNEAYHKAISLPQRVSSVKGLTEALKNLVALEREAYGIASASQPNDQQPVDVLPLTEAARRMAFLLSAGMQKAGR